MRNHKLLLILLLVVAGTTSLHAQNDNREWERSDSLAIQFSVNDITKIDVSPFQAGGLSFKKLLPNNRSFRIGFQLGGNQELINSDLSRIEPEVDTTINDDKFNRGDWSLRIDSQFLQEQTISEKDRINFYYGIGPALKLGFEMTTSDEINKIPQASDNQIRDWKHKQHHETHFWELGAGLSSAVGIEWYLNENFSLMLEYAPRMMIQFQNESNEFVSKIKQDTESEWEKLQEDKNTENYWIFNLYTSNTRFGISLYF